MARIMIVDDSPTLRASAKFTLEAMGHAVLQAENGAAALTALQSLGTAERAELRMIITDVNMPEMDGITFTRKVKGSEFGGLPVLIMTTESQDDLKEEGRKAGASAWLVKPFKADQLSDAVKRLVK